MIDQNRFITVSSIIWFFFILSIYFLGDTINAFKLTNGYKLGNDSYFFLKQAKQVLDYYFPLDQNATSYLGFIYFLSLFEYFSISLKYFVFFQILSTFLTSICIFKITKKIFNLTSARIAFLIYLFYFPLQIRNFYILTDLLFINFTIFTFYFLFNINKRNFIIAFILSLITLSIRPHAIILIPVIYIFIIFYFYYAKKYFLIYTVIFFSILISIPLIYFLNILIANEEVVSTLIKGEIIWGYKFDDEHNIKTSIDYGTGIIGLIKLISSNFYFFIKMFFLKILWCLVRVRPFYSDLHNLYINFFNFIIFPAFIYSFFIKSNYNLGRVTLLAFIFLFIIGIGFTFADWSGRFSLYIFPSTAIIASVSLARWSNFIMTKLNFHN